MYKLLIDITEGENRTVHALRYYTLRIVASGEEFVVEFFHEGNWRLGFRAESPLRWRLIDDGGDLLAGDEWSPVDSGDEGGQG